MSDPKHAYSSKQRRELRATRCVLPARCAVWVRSLPANKRARCCCCCAYALFASAPAARVGPGRVADTCIVQQYDFEISSHRWLRFHDA